MSGYYIGVDGKARKIKGGYIGVDGKARKIKKGYIGVNGVAQLCWTAFDGDPVFANNSWEKIIEACQTNNVPDSWVVGDQKTLTVDGTQYTIDIIGKNHDDYSDGSGKAPLTFQFHDMPADGMKMNETSTNVGGWAASKMRTVNLPSFLETFPEAVRNAICEVNKYSGEGYNTTNAILTQDKLFLLSGREITCTDATYATVGEGTQYEYYAADATRRYKKRKTFTSNAVWWTRSALKNKNAYFYGVSSDSGNLIDYSVTRTDYIAPAFCF